MIGLTVGPALGMQEMQEMDMMDGRCGLTSLSCMAMQELAPRRDGIGGRGTSVKWSLCWILSLRVGGARCRAEQEIVIGGKREVGAA